MTAREHDWLLQFDEILVQDSVWFEWLTLDTTLDSRPRTEVTATCMRNKALPPIIFSSG